MSKGKYRVLDHGCNKMSLLIRM